MTAPSYDIIQGPEDSPWLLTCDHASNRVPPEVAEGDLGLPASEMARHIAYDIGAAGVTRHLAELLDAPAVLSNFSRLVIDPNRGADDPTLVMRLYDGTIIPANRSIDAGEIARRKALFYDPYDAALEEACRDRTDIAYVAIHSFTPRLNGRNPRPWEVGVLYAWDERLSRPFIQALKAEGDLTVGENQPYAGHLPGDAVDRHALQHGRPNALIEIRHDLIATEAGQLDWAQRLAPLLTRALEEMHSI